MTLASIPLAQLDAYYHGVVLPLKQILDDEYMSRADFLSDFKLIVSSILRQWGELELSDLLPALPKICVWGPGQITGTSAAESVQLPASGY